jgi:Skp family chaperone for outer membrane proteins
MTTAAAADKELIIAEAKALTVKTGSDRRRAADIWDAIRAFRKQSEAQKEEVCRPLKTAWDQAKVPFDTFVKECQGYESRLQGLMSAWDREQDRLARAEQDRLQAIADKANAKIIEKAEAKGLEPVLKVAPVVQAQPKSIETQAGTTQSRSVKKVYGVKGMELQGDARADSPLVAQLLKDYPALFVLDRVKFNKLAATGMLDSHPNVTITEEYVYSQR